MYFYVVSIRVTLSCKVLDDLIHFYRYQKLFSTLSQKVATDAVQRAEKHLGNMCQNIGNINVKHGKIRDLADRLAHGCVAYGNEEYGTSLKELHHFAEHVSAVQDYRQAYVRGCFYSVTYLFFRSIKFNKKWCQSCPDTG